MSSQTAILVLGMHRSGTSCLTRILSLLGMALPEHVMPGGEGNEAGHWEPLTIVQLHDEVLAATGSQWSAFSGPPTAWFESDEARAFCDRLKVLIASEYKNAPMFVVKDPRLSLLFPLWSRALGELGIRSKAIIAVRNPIEIARSLAAREAAKASPDLWTPDRYAMIILRYLLAAERFTRTVERAFCSFDDLIGGWRSAIARLGDRLDISWPAWTAESERLIDEFVSPRRKRQTVTNRDEFSSEVWTRFLFPIYEDMDLACKSGQVRSDLFDRTENACGGLLQSFQEYSYELTRSYSRKLREVEETISLLNTRIEYLAPFETKFIARKSRNKRYEHMVKSARVNRVAFHVLGAVAVAIASAAWISFSSSPSLGIARQSAPQIQTSKPVAALERGFGVRNSMACALLRFEGISNARCEPYVYRRIRI